MSKTDDGDGDNDSAAERQYARRSIALGIIGALGGAGLLSSCTDSVSSVGPSLESAGTTSLAQALLGGSAAVLWVETILGDSSLERTGRNGDLATNSPTDLGVALSSIAGVVVIAKGSRRAGDGGGGIFYWDASNSSQDDGGTLIQPTAVTGPGRWRRFFSGGVNALWFGAAVSGEAGLVQNVQALQNAVATGKDVYVPAGTYVCDGALPIFTASRIWGDGCGVQSNVTGTSTLSFISGGLQFLSSSSSMVSEASKLEGLCIQSTRSNASNGLSVVTHGFVAERVLVTGFGGHGVVIGGGANANNFRLAAVRSTLNGASGFYVEGPDGNAGTFDTCDATANGAWGFDVGGAHNSMVHCHTAGNGSGGFLDRGNSNVYLHPYCESGQPRSLHVGNTSSWGVLLASQVYAFDQVTADAESYQASWTIMSRNGFVNHLYLWPYDYLTRFASSTKESYGIEVRADGEHFSILRAKGESRDTILSAGIQAGAIAFNGAAPMSTKPIVTGSRNGNDALASLLSALVATGLVDDRTSA